MKNIELKSEVLNGVTLGSTVAQMRKQIRDLMESGCTEERGGNVKMTNQEEAGCELVTRTAVAQ
jgi:hypothetical protein